MAETPATQSTEPLAATQEARRLELSYELAILAALVLLMALITLRAPRFLQTDNLFQIARNFSFIAAVGVGEALVILTGRGGIDLSVGSVVSLGGVVATKLLSLGQPLLLAMVAGTAAGVGVGLANGLLVTKARMTPLIPTLGMLSVAGGLALVITRGFPITELGPQADLFVALGAGFVGPVPAPVIYMAVVVLVGWIVTTRTPFGYDLYAVGGNEDAARVAGIDVDRVKLTAYVASGGLAALTGILLAARLSVGDATLGQGMELGVIAAVVIGGVSLLGGRGSILGLVIGAALIGVLQNGMVLMGVPAFWQQVVIGATIIVAVLLDRVRLRLVAAAAQAAAAPAGAAPGAVEGR
ncbi:MAG: ABC transporter permease [Armatimonadota bacterium]|nr:ABC transporter permease [Armatimonadota bacterium]MDR7458368.1 ABC transporter permease [Armatimonadota bacterium]MDR7478828.1 ABC transporter permease [Armatimonadota bacterium]MDR7488714.1 ABC transporter permease [Armatimonadota bacterium]MDR7490645.1 ABC transporter permease [Armatimonadota bacterium]